MGSITVTACSKQADTTTESSASAISTVQTAPLGSAPAPVATPTQTRTIPVQVQATVPAGVTLRVKGVELGPDATILDISASYSSQVSNNIDLGLMEGYLTDAIGTRLPLKRPDDNKYLRINDGETMEGKLVFLGAVPSTSREVTLILNEGNAPDNPAGPGIELKIPLAQ